MATREVGIDSAELFVNRLVPNGFWVIAAPLIPPPAKRPQGGGIPRADDYQVFCAIVFVLTRGCSWRHLPPTFGVSYQTAHRRFTEWSEAALWAKLHRAVLDRLGAADEIDWSRAIVDGASMRAKKGGSMTGPNPEAPAKGSFEGIIVAVSCDIMRGIGLRARIVTGEEIVPWLMPQRGFSRAQLTFQREGRGRLLRRTRRVRGRAVATSPNSRGGFERQV